jgi:hypothetical protein
MYPIFAAADMCVYWSTARPTCMGVQRRAKSTRHFSVAEPLQMSLGCVEVACEMVRMAI